MSDIALYNVLKKVGATHEEAEQAVADIASSKEVPTTTDLAKLENRLTWKMVAVGLAVIGIIKYL